MTSTGPFQPLPSWDSDSVTCGDKTQSSAAHPGVTGKGCAPLGGGHTGGVSTQVSVRECPRVCACQMGLSVPGSVCGCPCVCLSRHVGAAVLRHHLVAIATGPPGTWVPTALTLERGKAVENVQ